MSRASSQYVTELANIPMAHDRRTGAGKAAAQGYFSLIFQAHVPFAQQGDDWDPSYQWYYRLMSETILPLLQMFHRLLRDGVDFRFALAVSPTFLSMSAQYDVQQRLIHYFNHRIDHDDRFRDQLIILRDFYESMNRNVNEALKTLQELGYLEIIISPATNAFLPLLKNEESITAQIAYATSCYEYYLARKPKGFLLPASAYTMGIDRILKNLQIQYFLIDQHAIQLGTPAPKRDRFAPVLTPYGVHAVPLHQSAFKYCKEYENRNSKDYTDYHYTKHQMCKTYIAPSGNYPHPGEVIDSVMVRDHAGFTARGFINLLTSEMKQNASTLDRKPFITMTMNSRFARLSWYEGILYLEFFCRQLHYDQQYVQLSTPSEYFVEYPLSEIVRLNENDHTISKDMMRAIHPTNEWIYRHLHQAEDRMSALATQYDDLKSKRSEQAKLTHRAIQQAARELLLAQSSDWALLMEAKVEVDYAVQRTKNHLGRFHQLCQMIEQTSIDEAFLSELERKDGIFPQLDFLMYASISNPAPLVTLNHRGEFDSIVEETLDRPNIFMLAWEYPPKSVGGLSVAVRDLSEALAKQGQVVHVITTSHFGVPLFEKMNDVYVHRLPVQYSYHTDFYHWQFEMNLAMVEHLVRWKENGGRVDVIHAHDWMVYIAARELKHSFKIPLFVTIHATEWGRNQGVLYSDLQRKIHAIEWKLTYEATKVLVCSEYMRNEVQQVFSLPHEKIEVVHNGVPLDVTPIENLAAARFEFAPNGEKIIFYVGRLVFEKGVQCLIDALPGILHQVPNAKLIIAGSGSMEAELKSRAKTLKQHIQFFGYISDELKNKLFQVADVCVIPSFYEPFGIVALETMRYMRPLVISDTGGMKELVSHGVDGYKALPGHVESLTYHIVELLRNPQKGHQMAARAYEKLKSQYDWDKISQQTVDIYTSIHPEIEKKPKARTRTSRAKTKIVD